MRKVETMGIPRKPTEFEMAVYDAVRLIPKGKVSSYGRIAAEISRGTARSVGTALAKNPFAPQVPCHRVVRVDGSLGGFHGFTNGPYLVEKSAMLVAEGVLFNDDGRVASEGFVD
jgi:methylated-DNA-[protein]-cysteine S-methyltransferase